MSPAHFQRLFSHWVGVSPKRYQQYLTLDHASRCWPDRFTVLDTALGTGLSGGGRLHDLFLTWEAMTPGDYAKGGAGLTIYWGWFDSPFGRALVMGTDTRHLRHGVCRRDGRGQRPMHDLLGRWPHATFVEDPMHLRPWVAGGLWRSKAKRPLYLIGAPFQIKVWEALLSIPSGHVTTYSEIAARHRPSDGHPRRWHGRRPQPDQPG